jgi:hypothetical protein
MTNKPKNYLLYSDPDQTKLLAQAYSLDQAKEVSLEYDAGQWFSYDLKDEKELTNERKLKLPFGEFKKDNMQEEEKHVWSSLGGSDIR